MASPSNTTTDDEDEDFLASWAAARGLIVVTEPGPTGPRYLVLPAAELYAYFLERWDVPHSIH